MDHIEELLTRRVQQILPSRQGLEAMLRSGKKIRIYQGFDPSKPNLHIGHLVGLQQLRQFQDLGHEVIFLIGDFTGMIGDPTDKRAARPRLTREEVLLNAQTYREQAGKILRFDGENPVQLKYNSEWLAKLGLADLIEIMGNFTYQQIIERDMFQDRIQDNKPIYLHEFIYPLMVTYDALFLEVDLEIGGNDQLFNMTVGRNYLKEKIHKDKYALTLKLLTDKDGNKIGKTSGNAINLFDNPRDLFGQIMALPDDVVINAFNLITQIEVLKIHELEHRMTTEPMQVKKLLASEIVRLCHGNDKADSAQQYFETTFQQRSVAAEIPQIIIQSAQTLMDILKQSNLGVSNAQIKRVIEAGGVEYNQKKITDPNTMIVMKTGDTVKYGKHTFYKVKIEN